jgi:hypothetical protein
LFVECEGKPSTSLNEDSEDIEVLMLTKKDAMELLQDGTVKLDVKTWIVLNNFVSQGAL